MENLRLEDLWRNRLISNHWPDRAAKQIQSHWAKSTMDLYNRLIVKFRLFCADKDISFQSVHSSHLAEFFCLIADSSDRPASLIRSTSAAISCLYGGLNIPCPIDSDISILKSALVKSGTKTASIRTGVMPCSPFYELFKRWSAEQLSVQQLRLRAVTLLALCFMTRPSDLAPKGMYFDPITHELEHLIFSTDDVVFHENNQLTIMFFGTKNDTDRSGFQVTIPGSNDPASDPVGALQSYIRATSSQRELCTGNPVFVTLRKPYRAVQSGSIANILQEAITLAGLGGKGFTPRCFRPTGATAAVKNNTKPETAMMVGRWKTDKVFRERYVYPLVQESYTSDVLEFRGVTT